jgi:hypothetical protein
VLVVELIHSRLSHRLEGGDIAYKLYANCPSCTKSPFFLKFAPSGLKTSVKSVMLPGQKGLLIRQLDRIFAFPGRKFSTFILNNHRPPMCFTH